MLCAFSSHLFFCQHVQCVVRHVANLIKICFFFEEINACPTK